MIRFNCNCSNEFLVSEDQAGGLIQCPKCGRLNDIPALSDVQSLEDGGIYKMDAKPAGPAKSVLPAASRAYTHDRIDDSGDEIDMRHGVDEFLSIGIPREEESKPLPPKPKYDPLTGELMEELDIKPDARATPTDVNNIPVAKRAVAYATADISPRVTPLTILIHLFQPMNVFVMLFVLAAHVLLQMIATICECGFFFLVPVMFIVAGLILSHYGAVIDEIGTVGSDELPRPLRNLDWYDDLWGPCFRYCEAILVCFGPAIFAFRYVPGIPGWALSLTAFIFGVYFFPAMLLTTQTAGSALNLRVDRLIGVIRACGARYWISVLSFMIATPIYLFAMFGLDRAVALLFRPKSLGASFLGILIFTPALLLGIYLYHFCCWFLGLLYRANHPRFPWVLQRHVYSRRTDLLSQLEAARAASRLAVLQKNKPDRDQRLAEIRTAEAAKKAGNSDDNRQIWDRVAE